jgi:hypothetical protein
MGDRTLTWFVVSLPDNDLPEWARTVAVAEDETVFVTAMLGVGGEAAVGLMAIAAGVPVVVNGGHAYLPADWMAGAYPDVAVLCRQIESLMLREFRRDRVDP